MNSIDCAKKLDHIFTSLGEVEINGRIYRWDSGIKSFVDEEGWKDSSATLKVVEGNFSTVKHLDKWEFDQTLSDIIEDDCGVYAMDLVDPKNLLNNHPADIENERYQFIYFGRDGSLYVTDEVEVGECGYYDVVGNSIPLDLAKVRDYKFHTLQ